MAIAPFVCSISGGINGIGDGGVEGSTVWMILNMPLPRILLGDISSAFTMLEQSVCQLVLRLAKN